MYLFNKTREDSRLQSSPKKAKRVQVHAAVRWWNSVEVYQNVRREDRKVNKGANAFFSLSC